MTTTPEQLQAPTHNLPTWSKCEIVINTPKETPLHRFIYEYDDANGFKSDWFMHRLELVIKDAEKAGRKQALEDAIAICSATCDPHNTEHGNGYNRAALDCEKKIKELLND